MQMDLADDLPPVNGDRVQLQQVIINLLRNGIDAMREIEDRPRQLLIQTEWDGGEKVGSLCRILVSASLPIPLIGSSNRSSARRTTVWALGSRSAVPSSRHIMGKYGRDSTADRGRLLYFQFPVVSGSLREWTAGMDTKVY
jgi:hypothetical protein